MRTTNIITAKEDNLAPLCDCQFRVLLTFRCLTAGLYEIWIAQLRSKPISISSDILSISFTCVHEVVMSGPELVFVSRNTIQLTNMPTRTYSKLSYVHVHHLTDNKYFSLSVSQRHC